MSPRDSRKQFPTEVASGRHSHPSPRAPFQRLAVIGEYCGWRVFDVHDLVIVLEHEEQLSRAVARVRAVAIHDGVRHAVELADGA